MRSLHLASLLITLWVCAVASGQPIKPPPGTTIDEAPTAHHLARVDVLDDKGESSIVVAAVFIEPTVLVIHAEALRRASSIKIDNGSCTPSTLVGVIAVDPDHRLALIRIDVPPEGVAPYEVSSAPLQVGQVVTCQAMLFPMECGFATSHLKPYAVQAAHRLSSFGHNAAVAIPPSVVVSGSAVLDADGHLAGLLEDGRDGVTSNIVSVHEVMSIERTDPISIGQFNALPPPPAVAAVQLAQAATAKREQRQLAEARRLVDQALALDPGCWLAHYEQGVCADLGDRPDEAVTSLARSMEIEPAFCESHYSLGIVHLRQGQPEQAIAPLKEATRLNPAHSTALAMLCVALESTGDLDAAFRAGEASIALEPSDRGIYANLAILYNRHSRPDDAIRVWQRRVELRSSDTAARMNLGDLLYDAERYPECVEALAPIFEDAQIDPPSLAQLAVSRWATDDRAGAIAAARRGAERFPGERVFQELLRRFESDETQSPRSSPRTRGKD